VITWASAVVLALAQFRLIAFVFGDQYERCVAAAQGVTSGRPHWRIYQSRVLSPYLVDALSHVTPSFLSAHVLFSLLALAVAGVLAARIGERVAGARGGLLAMFVFHAVFAMLLARPWIYAWDFVDAIVFLLFVDFVLASRPWPWFVALSALGSLNHEVALYISAWLVADPAIRWWLGRRDGARFAWKPAAAGVVCFAAMLVVVELVRSALLVEAIGPKMFPDAPPDIGSSFYFALPHNLTILRGIFTHFDYGMPFVIPCFLVAAIAIAAWLARRDPARFGALALTYVLVIASLLVFGVLVETRIYIVLIPLVVLGAVRPDMS
jgi:hypothetical protein